jgi:hypothetical protein
MKDLIEDLKKNIKKNIWLWISSFGVMFAILSFSNEIGIFDNDPSYIKGITAIITGTILFFILPYKLK